MNIIETLTQLATAGTSGVCILAIFWVGTSIQKSGNQEHPEKFKTLRAFMIMCVAIAVVSALSALLVSRNNSQKLAAVVATNDRLSGELQGVATNAGQLEGILAKFEQEMAILKKKQDQLDAARDPSGRSIAILADVRALHTSLGSGLTNARFLSKKLTLRPELFLHKEATNKVKLK